jgi:hypothetical protein
MFNDTSTSVNYTIYKTTVSKLLAIQSTITLWEAYQEGILEIAEEGAVTSSAPSPSGINFFDLFIAMGDNPEDDELYAFIGSQLKICSALHYGARALVFGLGYEEGQLGGVNVNRADLTTKTERQAETGAP